MLRTDIAMRPRSAGADDAPLQSVEDYRERWAVQVVSYGRNDRPHDRSFLQLLACSFSSSSRSPSGRNEVLLSTRLDHRA